MADQTFISALNEPDKVAAIKAFLNWDTVLLSDGSVKVAQNLVVGDRSGAAQLTIDSATGSNSDIVLKNNGTKVNQVLSRNDRLVIESLIGDVEFVAPAGSAITAKIGGVFHTVAMTSDLERPTVVSPYGVAPSKVELIIAFKLLPLYTNDVSFWGVGHDFYVKDDPQTKMVLAKYRPLTTSVSEATAGNFFFEKLTLAT